MKLPKIYQHFKEGQVFTIEEAREKLGTTGNTLRKRLSELAAGQYIRPIRQGLYRLEKIEISPHKTPSAHISPYAIAAKLSHYCYIGYKTALCLHAQEMPLEQDSIYVVSPTKFNHFKFENRLYFWCQTPEAHGLETYLLKENNFEFPVLATNFEKSIVDCLKRPAHCPSFFDLVRLCEKNTAIPDMDKILKYASDCQIQSVFNRIGFLLEKNQERWKVDSGVFKFVEERMMRKLTDWPILACSPQVLQSLQTPKIENNLSFLTSILQGKSRWKIQFQDSVIS